MNNFNPMQLMQMMQEGNMNPMQLIGMFKKSNPMQLLKMFEGNPTFEHTKKMVEGKDIQQIQETIMNVAKQKGMNEEQVRQMAQQFGVKF